MPELSIDQLSDLKIAIVENKKQLDALKQEKESVAAENLHFKSENTRLTEEIQSQVFNKENLVKENDKLREEKQKIYDEYDEKQGKISLEITAKKEKLDNQEALVNARLEELTGRENSLVDKQASHEKDVLNFKVLKEEYEMNVLHLKQKEDRIFEKENEVHKKNLSMQEERKVILEEEKRLKELKEAVKDTQNKAQLDIENNNKVLHEVSIKKEEIEVMKNRYEALVPVYNELKNYIVKHAEDGTAEQFMTLENIMFKKIEEEKGNYFKKKEEEKKEEEKKEEEKVDDGYDKMSYKDLKELAKKHGLDFGANPKTENLIAIIREFDKNNKNK